MEVRKAYKFRLQPNVEQKQKIAQTAGCVRLVWNRSLAEIRSSLDAKAGYKGYVALANEMKTWKSHENTSFLKLVHSQPLQQTLKDLDLATRAGFKKEKGFPKFKKKSSGNDSFRYPQGVKVENRKIWLPKIGWVKFRKSQTIEGKIKNATVSKRAGCWYVAVQVEIELPTPVHPNKDHEVGIDLGIARFASLTDGNILTPLNSYRKNEKRLAKAQRELSRKKKGSNNRDKAKWKVQRLHKRIADSRLDYLHKSTTWIAKNHGKVILEDLQVSGMSRSAKGTKENPGRNVKAKSGLNKSILDQGWFEFKRQLGYKLEWLGGELVLVSPRYTSQKCFACGHVSKENRKTQSCFSCEECGHTDNADANAALNILAAGRAVSACGDISSITS